jgi:hypothetical protein
VVDRRPSEHARREVANNVPVAEQLPMVRDLDPTSLLARLPPGGDLQPYVPRDVDAELDRALRLPGLVVIAFGERAGARRSTYEALRRNLPSAVLYTPALAEERMDSVPGHAVLWMDPGRSGRMSVAFSVGLLERWLANPGRSAVVLVSLQGSGLQRFLEPLDRFEPRVVQMSGELSATERMRASDGTRTVDELAARLGSTTVEAPPEVSWYVAGYSADTAHGPDRLGFTDDVDMLADLVASRLVKPPLSIGLFGNWGSGKSFFMRQMRSRVRLLAGASRIVEQQEGRRGLEVSSYCSSIKQIDFNAWHYVEANLWASLATHIFDELAAGTTDEELAQLDEKRKSESLLEQLSAVRVKRRLVAARGAPLKLSGDDLAWVAQEVGVPSATTDDVLTFARQVRGVGAKARLLAKNAWTWVALGVGATLAVGLAFLVRSAAWPALLGAVPVLAVAARVLARVQRIRDAAETRTNRQLAELDAEADRLERAVAELAHDVTAFARSRHVDYQRHLGVVSMLRKDLETFAKVLASDANGPERVVLYIDDLDRCPPEVVIKVLEAVHLLVALPVFVVVVGVDPRWLHQAIRHHYATVLPDAAITSTDYLEKIFQIPFQLSPMDARGFSGLVQDLAGDDDDPFDIPAVTEEEPPQEPQVEAPEPVEPDLGPGMRPRQLTITQEEVDFIATLAQHVPSPRAAKRLTNLYRLVRARLSGPELDEFLASDQYKAVLVLLATGGKPDSQLPQEVYEKWLPLVRRFSFGHANGPQPETGGRSSMH